MLHVALPCLVVRQLSNDRANPEDMLWMLLAAAMVFGFASIIAYIFLKIAKQEVKTYLAAFTPEQHVDRHRGRDPGFR